VLRAALGIGLGAWALGLAAANQRRLIFKPPKHVRELPPRRHACSFRIGVLSTPAGDGAVLPGWRTEPLTAEPQRSLFYFGGRREDLAWAPHTSSYLAGW
jgi:hypothetical protein